ncbi:hypothetical protein Sjap_000431 [Stephania japonica]|uniref:EF-hand domain-containing protein n=1 Tax=Stephania japonica TaxID=461633 RepID=A0AAP0PU05_9MAGN
MLKLITFLALVLISALDLSQGRFIITRSINSSLGAHSDGVAATGIQPPTVLSTVTCEPMYGFMPCATSLWGQLFLFVVYQYLLYFGDYYISAGSELLFKILGPGVFGASAFHLLGSLPQAALVLATGVYGSKEYAQEQVVGGMGILAGSTVFLLTLVWATCLFVGKFDISGSSTSSKVQQRKLFKLTGTGVTTDVETSYTARIMLLSMTPFIVAQLPQIFGSKSGGHIVMLISLIITLLLLFMYCFYQVFQPWIQNRRLEYLISQYIENNLLQKLLTADGEPQPSKITDLFRKMDRNKDKFITTRELNGLILGLQVDKVGLDEDDLLEKILKEFDTSGDAHIDENEFVRGISKWLSETKQSRDRQARRRCSINQSHSSMETDEEQHLLEDQKEKKAKPTKRVNQTFTSAFIKAASFILFGTFILTILAAPIIDTVQNFSTAVNIPSFFIFFVVVPIGVNYREAVSTITSIRKRTQLSVSLTFSEIYSAVFMNNLVGLAMFLGIVYLRGLVWDFSAEVFIVLVVCLVMGFYTSFNTTFPLWTSLVLYMLYPLSILLLYVLTYFFGWK